MNVVKLDKRYDGWDRFTHRVEFLSRDRVKNQKQWIKARNWLWTQFGPSAELDLARRQNFEGVQPVWAWDANKSSIYVTQEAYTMFMLRKEFWEDEANL